MPKIRSWSCISGDSALVVQRCNSPYDYVAANTISCQAKLTGQPRIVSPSNIQKSVVTCKLQLVPLNGDFIRFGNLVINRLNRYSKQDVISQCTKLNDQVRNALRRTQRE